MSAAPVGRYKLRPEAGQHKGIGTAFAANLKNESRTAIYLSDKNNEVIRIDPMSNVTNRRRKKPASKKLRRDKRLQVAALCYKETKRGRQVLLITSRDTGRWIVPKGWPMKGKDDHEAALIEAWEEAGVSKADIEEEPMGVFEYAKGLSSGDSVPVEAQVYLTRVRDLQKSYPEVHQRTREWFNPKDAAELVDEPDLKKILRAI